MNRVIKFRAWDGEQMIMNWMKAEYRPPQVIKGTSLPHYYAPSFISSAGAQEVMQFTGLQDKNGVDIYEGDIVLGGNPGKIGTTYTCLFEQLSCSFKFAYVGKTLNCSLENVEGHLIDISEFTHPEQMTVIGNIHQNPELLEAS